MAWRNPGSTAFHRINSCLTLISALSTTLNSDIAQCKTREVSGDFTVLLCLISIWVLHLKGSSEPQDPSFYWNAHLVKILSLPFFLVSVPLLIYAQNRQKQTNKKQNKQTHSPRKQKNLTPLSSQTLKSISDDDPKYILHFSVLSNSRHLSMELTAHKGSPSLQANSSKWSIKRLKTCLKLQSHEISLQRQKSIGQCSKIIEKIPTSGTITRPKVSPKRIMFIPYIQRKNMK